MNFWTLPGNEKFRAGIMTLLTVAATFGACSSTPAPRGGRDMIVKPNLPEYCLLAGKEGRADEGKLPACAYTITVKFPPLVYRKAAQTAFGRNVWGSNDGDRERFIAVHTLGDQAYQSIGEYMQLVYQMMDTTFREPRVEQLRMFDQALNLWREGEFDAKGPSKEKLQESAKIWNQLAAYEGVKKPIERWAKLWAAWIELEHLDEAKGVKAMEALALSEDGFLSAPALSHLNLHFLKKHDKAKSLEYAKEIVRRYDDTCPFAYLRYICELQIRNETESLFPQTTPKAAPAPAPPAKAKP